MEPTPPKKIMGAANFRLFGDMGPWVRWLVVLRALPEVLGRHRLYRNKGFCAPHDALEDIIGRTKQRKFGLLLI